MITAGFSTAADWKEEFGVARQIRAVVWHDMEGYLAGAISTWNTGKAGAHLSVLRDGIIVLTCYLAYVAYHAGTNNTPGSPTYGRTPFWRSHNINPYAVGVELEGYAASGFTAAQVAACRRISDYLEAVHGVPKIHVADQIDGHHTHAEISSQRSDPGPYWDWAWVL